MNQKIMFMIVAAICFVIIALTGRPDPSANEAIAESTQEIMTSEEEVTTEVKLKPALDHSELSSAPLSNDYVMGNENAPVTLIEYASLSCPHCATFHNKVLPDIKKHYINTGKVRYILRQFPLNEPAMAGAMLVHCVGEEGGAGRYYQFNNVLFDAQNKWAFDANFKDSLRIFAEVGGVPAGKFEGCLNNSKREKALLVSRKVAGEELNVSGTPFIFLNGHPHAGNKTFPALKREIDYLLGGKN